MVVVVVVVVEWDGRKEGRKDGRGRGVMGTGPRENRIVVGRKERLTRIHFYTLIRLRLSFNIRYFSLSFLLSWIKSLFVRLYL